MPYSAQGWQFSPPHSFRQTSEIVDLEFAGILYAKLRTLYPTDHGLRRDIAALRIEPEERELLTPREGAGPPASLLSSLADTACAERHAVDPNGLTAPRKKSPYAATRAPRAPPWPPAAGAARSTGADARAWRDAGPAFPLAGLRCSAGKAQRVWAAGFCETFLGLWQFHRARRVAPAQRRRFPTNSSRNAIAAA